jgi:hypothetical protein
MRSRIRIWPPKIVYFSYTSSINTVPPLLHELCQHDRPLRDLAISLKGADLAGRGVCLSSMEVRRGGSAPPGRTQFGSKP